MPEALRLLRTQDTKEVLTDTLIDAMEQTFVNMFTCSRSWDAWDNGTMTKDDFIPLNKEDELFHDVLLSFKERYFQSNDQRLPLNIEKMLSDSFDDEGVDPLINKNIDKSFHKEDFNIFSWEQVDASDIILAISDYQLGKVMEIQMNEQRKLKKKQRMAI